MKKTFYSIFLWIGFFLHLCSCTMPNGVSFAETGNNGEKTIKVSLSQVNLRFDFSKKLITNFIIGDYGEFIAYHGVPYNESFSGAITNLSTILPGAEVLDDAYKPSITITLEDAFMKKTEIRCKPEQITGNTILGIPNIEKLYKGTVEIKSIKTQNNGIQVVWKKSATNDNWPINQFVADGTISCDISSIIKVGTNNANGNVAARRGKIINNTFDTVPLEDTKYVVSERQLLSPDLQKNVIISGEISEDIKWSKPVIYNTIEL